MARIRIKTIASARLTDSDGAPLRLINPHAGHAGRNAAARHPAVSSIRCRVSRSASREIFCAFSKKAARSNFNSAFRTRSKRRANRRDVFPNAASARSIASIRFFSNLQKTRLHDPLLGFMGSNDHPGDYRSSGCTACHVVYANDRSPTHSGWYSKYGNQGLSFSGDQSDSAKTNAAIRSNTNSRARFRRSQCMNCHMHQGNLFVNPYPRLHLVGPGNRRRIHVSEAAEESDRRGTGRIASQNNPEAAAARGLWGDLDFLEKVAELNPKLKHTQFADYHGHGWIFRAVFKKDRQGQSARSRRQNHSAR